MKTRTMSILWTFLIAAILAAHSFMIWDNSLNIPIWDDYDVVLEYIQIVMHGEPEFGPLRKINSLRWQNNEHRVFFVHLAPLGYYLTTGSLDLRGLLLLFNGVFLLLLSPLFLRPTRRALTCLLVLLAFILHPVNFEVFLWVTGAYQHGVGALLALWTFFLLARNASVFAICVPGVLAMFTTGTGLLVLPIAGLALFSQDRKRDLVFLSGIFAVSLLVFFFDYNRPESDRDIFAMISSLPGFFVALGSLFSGVSRGLAAILGIVGISAFAYSIWQGLHRSSPFWFSAALYFLAVVFSASLVRASGETTTPLSRYVFYSYMAFACIAILVLQFPQVSRGIKVAIVALALAVNISGYVTHEAGVKKKKGDLVLGMGVFHCTNDVSKLDHWDQKRAGNLVRMFSERNAYEIPVQELQRRASASDPDDVCEIYR